jgi:pilus assembly protein Flp/PilA
VDVLTTYEFLEAWTRSRGPSDRGASLIEYALLAALIAVVCVVAVTFLGQTVSDDYSLIGSAVAN